jgi:DNA repair protein RAD5
MSKLEKGIDANEETKTLNPCWSAYNIADRYALFSVFFTKHKNAD